MTGRRSVKSDPDRAADAHERGRDNLGPPQVDRLLAAAKKGRHGIRDHLLMLMTYRHGLRVSEAVALHRDHVDLAQSRLWVARLKNGLGVEHPVAGDELRAIRRWLARRDDDLPWLFVSERRQPMTKRFELSHFYGANVLKIKKCKTNRNLIDEPLQELTFPSRLALSVGMIKYRSMT